MLYKYLLHVPRGIRAIISTHVKAFGSFSRLVVFNPCKTDSLFHKTMSYPPQSLWGMEGGFFLSTVYVVTPAKIHQGTQLTSLDGKGHLFLWSWSAYIISSLCFLRTLTHKGILLFAVVVATSNFTVFCQRWEALWEGLSNKPGPLTPSSGTHWHLPALINPELPATNIKLFPSRCLQSFTLRFFCPHQSPNLSWKNVRNNTLVLACVQHIFFSYVCFL